RAAEEAAKKAAAEAFNDGFSAGEERGRNEGISLGITQAKLETAKNALSMNLTLEQVSSLTGLSIEEIEKL
ncbi:MAG: hypothetical protein II196_01065, partial [Spirochaetales bacterium]|nr:hypothetical protein [Spirochaetales bacterium]